MKKYLNELDSSQLTIYEYFKRVTTQDGDNFKNVLMEVEEGFENVTDNVYNAYQSLNSVERIEVIHFFTKYLLKKNNN
ncbi:hypothetical protein ABD87_15055 [Lysinibacillus sphaericus]|uniref:hypothetical protein n=1 Tax=Lysinibacillus sphaericus TaxID=1421 RepID=UPI0018CD3867|nr:hypothetical protein [Lysinibacillus sphaericus]MBG9730808.1 hypothetical protein [Lysinibacillus sphaericus]